MLENSKFLDYKHPILLAHNLPRCQAIYLYYIIFANIAHIINPIPSSYVPIGGTYDFFNLGCKVWYYDGNGNQTAIDSTAAPVVDFATLKACSNYTKGQKVSGYYISDSANISVWKGSNYPFIITRPVLRKSFSKVNYSVSGSLSYSSEKLSGGRSYYGVFSPSATFVQLHLAGGTSATSILIPQDESSGQIYVVFAVCPPWTNVSFGSSTYRPSVTLALNSAVVVA